jgi:hypothetical protein
LRSVQSTVLLPEDIQKFLLKDQRSLAALEAIASVAKEVAPTQQPFGAGLIEDYR